MKRHVAYPFFLVMALSSGFFLGTFYDSKKEDAGIIVPVREKQNEYAFINPLLFYEIPNSIELKEYKPLADKIEKIINSNERKNLSISVYYRDLSVGRWFGIGEDIEYVPASLMKVVLMIAYLKQAENQEQVLAKRINFSKEIQNIIGVLPYDQGTELELNKSYTVEELINRMIIESDNGATYSLLYTLDDKLLDQIYADLGFKNPGKNEGAYMISAHNYASFLRILYNATYLNRKMSEYALSLLSKTDFNSGLRANIDKSIKIAHKYGQSISTIDGDTISSIELHDCGIIYYPKKPYLLCIMTKGRNLSELTDTVKKISQIVYDDLL